MNNWLTKIKTPNNLTRKLLGFFKTLLIGAVCGSFDKKKPLIISSIIGLLISQIIINCKKKKSKHYWNRTCNRSPCHNKHFCLTNLLTTHQPNVTPHLSNAGNPCPKRNFANSTSSYILIYMSTTTCCI